MLYSAADEYCCRSTIKIFVGNIKIGTSSAELREAFEKHGTVTEADVIGGYGFVVSKCDCHICHFLLNTWCCSSVEITLCELFIVVKHHVFISVSK